LPPDAGASEGGIARRDPLDIPSIGVRVKVKVKVKVKVRVRARVSLGYSFTLSVCEFSSSSRIHD